MKDFDRNNERPRSNTHRKAKILARANRRKESEAALTKAFRELDRQRRQSWAPHC